MANAIDTNSHKEYSVEGTPLRWVSEGYCPFNDGHLFTEFVGDKQITTGMLEGEVVARRATIVRARSRWSYGIPVEKKPVRKFRIVAP